MQAKEQCQRAHFWVLVAPERHVLFRFSPPHDSEAVDRLLKGYSGYLVADAHAVYGHLYASGNTLFVSLLASWQLHRIEPAPIVAPAPRTRGRARECQAKGAIEPWHRTWRDEVEIEPPRDPRHDLNARHWAWLAERHHHRVHATGQAPLSHCLSELEHIRPGPGPAATRPARGSARDLSRAGSSRRERPRGCRGGPSRPRRSTMGALSRRGRDADETAA